MLPPCVRTALVGLRKEFAKMLGHFIVDYKNTKSLNQEIEEAQSGLRFWCCSGCTPIVPEPVKLYLSEELETERDDSVYSL